MKRHLEESTVYHLGIVKERCDQLQNEHDKLRDLAGTFEDRLKKLEEAFNKIKGGQ